MKMYLYLGLAIVSIIFGVLIKNPCNQRQRKVYLFIVFGVLTFLACFRGSNVGTDTISYRLTFQLVKSYGFAGFGADHSVEYGYFAVVWLFTKIFSSPQSIIIFFTGTTYIIIAYSIYKYSDDVVLSTFLFVVWILPSTMNGMRQHFAFSLILLSIFKMLENQNLKALILIIIAINFHNSALIFIPFLLLYPILKKLSGLKGYVVLCLGFIGVTFLLDKIIQIVANYIPRYEHYLTSDYYNSVRTSNTVWIGIYTVLIVMYLIIVKYKEKNKESCNLYNENIYAYYLLLTLLHIIVIILSNNARGIFQRLSVYSEYGVVFLMVYVINNFFIYTRIRLNYRSIILVKCGVYILFLIWDVFMLKQNPHHIIPYTFCK